VSAPECTCFLWRGNEPVSCIVHPDATLLERAFRHPGGFGVMVEDAFARARANGAAAERAAVVRFLRSGVNTSGRYPESVPAWLADLLEAGAHRVGLNPSAPPRPLEWRTTKRQRRAWRGK